ncbi:IS66 family insertion sequence element accessory protein TnpB [Salmonella enterica]|nr:hypothetical protein [Salmonella enterica]EHG3238401.1 IS66 family insertion sequence element accessory protein TnpB [Salmonella enterica]
MISLPAGSRIWLVAGVTDMRNGFNGLASRVQNTLRDDPFSGHLFIFRGRRGDMIKVLWADRDGLCLALGRKNWLFAGSDAGGERAAILYSLIVTCRLNGVEPEAWLRYVLGHIQDWPVNRLRDLLPWKADLTSA